MTLSVLIVSYGVCDRLERCLAALGNDVEIVVIDNASPDNSAAMVRSRFPSVRLIAWPENRGFAKAVNEAARVARGDVLLLLNPDAIVDSSTLAQMPAALLRRDDAAAIGFRQVNEEGHYQLTIGPPPSLVLELVRRAVQRRLDAGSYRLGTFIDHRLNRPRPVPWVAASVLLVRRQAFEQIGGFDENFFLYFEDIDFCLRLRAQGGKVYYDPTLTVMHTRGASAKGAAQLAQRAYRDSQLYYWQKHRGACVRYLVRAYQRLGRLA